MPVPDPMTACEATASMLSPSGSVMVKVCLGPCGRELPLECFGKAKEGHYGRRSRCKECRNLEEKQRRAVTVRTEEQKAASRAQASAWAKANPERRAQNARLYYEDHKDAIKARSKGWQHQNPEKKKAYNAKWAAENKETTRRYAREWQAANKDLYRSIQKRWRTEHVGYWRLRASQLKNTRSDFTFDQWVELLGEFNHSCAYCLRSDVKLTMDHMTPLSKGGEHTRSNIVPACKPCNSRKKDRSIFYMFTV